MVRCSERLGVFCLYTELQTQKGPSRFYFFRWNRRYTARLVDRFSLLLNQGAGYCGFVREPRLSYLSACQHRQNGGAKSFGLFNRDWAYMCAFKYSLLFVSPVDGNAESNLGDLQVSSPLLFSFWGRKCGWGRRRSSTYRKRVPDFMALKDSHYVTMLCFVTTQGYHPHLFSFHLVFCRVCLWSKSRLEKWYSVATSSIFIKHSDVLAMSLTFSCTAG